MQFKAKQTQAADTLSSPSSCHFYFHSVIEWKRGWSSEGPLRATSAKVPEMESTEPKDILVLGSVFANAVAQFRIRVGTWRYGLLLNDTRKSNPLEEQNAARGTHKTSKQAKRKRKLKHNSFGRVCLCESVWVPEYLCEWIGPVLFGPFNFISAPRCVIKIAGKTQKYNEWKIKY